MGLSVLDFLVIVVVFATGNLFTIENGEFVPGLLFAYRGVLPGLLLVGLFIFFVKNYKLIGIRSFWLTILFLLVPTIATVVVDVFIKTRFSYAATN